MGKTNSTVRYISGSFIWGAISKFLDAGIKFLTIPILLNFFGKENYGLLTLAIATNAYMALLDLGMNIGAVKFFSQWISVGKYDLLHRTARTSITFYLGISLINSIVLVALGIWGADVFQITLKEFATFQKMLFLLAAFSVVNWITFVFNQLLIADEKIAFTHQIASVKSVLGLVAVGAVILFNWSLIQYFVIYLAINSFVIVPYFFICKREGLIDSLFPAFYWQDFVIVFKYGLAILAMSLFQFSAIQSRPIVLAMFSKDGVGILAEYRIMEVFPLFIISIGGMLVSVFLPKTSRAIQNGDKGSIEKMAYLGTKYTSILVSVLCFPVMLSAQELLSLYVGAEYSHLTVWLFLWVFTLTLSLHNSPVSSLVLATGKTKMLVYSTAIASVISIILNALLANVFGVGSAVIGYLVYIIIQVLFYYLYFNNKVLGLKSLRVFKAYIVPTGLGGGAFVIVYFFGIESGSLYVQIIINSVQWGVIYFLMLRLFRVVDLQSVKRIFMIKQ